MKPNLEIYTAKEASDAEVEIIRQSFADHFDVSVHKEIMRFSEGQLPLIVNIAIGVLSSLIATGLVASVKRLFSTLPPKKADRATVEIKIKDSTIITGHDNKTIIINYTSEPTPTQTFYKSLQEAIDTIKKDDENP